MTEISTIMCGIEALYHVGDNYPFLDGAESTTNLYEVIRCLGSVIQVSKNGVQCTNTYVNLDLKFNCRSGYRDPWGCSYHLILNRDRSSKVKVGESEISNNVAVWSNGPNRRNDLGSADDICSWNIEFLRRDTGNR